MSSLVLDRPAPAAHKVRTMKAWRVKTFGGTDAMTLEDVPLPQPGPGEILVKVAAAGVGPWDGWIRSGNSALPQPLPLTLGSDLSGTVITVGEGVTDLRPGDRVAIEPGVPCRHCHHCKVGRYNLCPEMVFCATPPYDGNLCRTNPKRVIDEFLAILVQHG